MTVSIPARSAPSPGRPGGAPRRSRAVCIALFAAATAWPAGAELVVLADGDFLKVESFELIKKGYRLELPSGGQLILPRGRVSRIIDDEIVAVEAPAESPPAFTLRFDDQPAPSVPYGEDILVASKRHGLNPEVIAAVIFAESSFRPTVVSHKGAQGLMQLM
ncbi:MAG: transglycosylase SLT domain-containing protein, partial [Acidobacteriota bacterium]